MFGFKLGREAGLKNVWLEEEGLYVLYNPENQKIWKPPPGDGSAYKWVNVEKIARMGHEETDRLRGCHHPMME